MKKVLSILMICVLCFTLVPSTASAAVKISKKSITIEIGQKYALTVKGTTKKVKWNSSNLEVATVDKTGMIKAKE